MDFKAYRPKKTTKTEVKGSIKPAKITEDESGITLNLEMPISGKALTVAGVRIAPAIIKDDAYLQLPIKSLQYTEEGIEPTVTDLGSITLHIPTLLEKSGMAATDDNVQSLEKPVKKGGENAA